MTEATLRFLVDTAVEIAFAARHEAAAVFAGLISFAALLVAVMIAVR